MKVFYYQKHELPITRSTKAYYQKHETPLTKSTKVSAGPITKSTKAYYNLVFCNTLLYPTHPYA